MLFYVDGNDSFGSLEVVVEDVVYVVCSIIDGMYLDLLVLFIVMNGY